MNLARYAWDEPAKPTAREQLARELRESHLDAERIARRRRIERKRQMRAHLFPALAALVIFACFVGALWGSTP